MSLRGYNQSGESQTVQMNEGKFSIHPTRDHRGNGLFLDRAIKKDEIVFSVVQGMCIVQPFAFVNHACEPSCVMHYDKVIAGRDLAPGDEITIDYGSILFACRPLEFACKCGFPKCRGIIRL
jgi:SET domain-containing protein